MSVMHMPREVRLLRSRRGHCPQCGKRLTRSRTFTRYYHPSRWNPAEDRPITFEEFAKACAAEAEAWVPDFLCRDCEPPDRWAIRGMRGTRY